MKAMETLQDLIEEAKVRAVWWGLCIFGISYFLSHTSKSMWTNIPISILILCALRYLCYEVDFRWRVRRVHKQTYLSHLQKKQLSLTDPRLGTLPSMPKWTRKIDSPPVEAAIRDFINKVLQDFVVDLWYSSITPDKEAPELIRGIILDCIGEISGRIKEINLVDLLTRDMVELIGNHLDLFRKNQSIIGAKVMETLSSEERDERLKYHMMVSKELHPALTSPECEYKVLQQLIGGLLAIVLDSREAQCPLVRCFSRELLTCLVMEPVMNLASPGYINELIEVIFLAANDNKDKEASTPGMVNAEAFHQHNSSIGNSQSSDHGARRNITSSQSGDMILAGTAGEISTSKITMFQEDSAYSLHPRPADWARVLDAATQRRTEVLTPENLENMWTKGRNYKKKTAKLAKAAVPGTVKMNSEILDNYVHAGCGKESSTSIHNTEISSEKKYPVQSSVIVVNAKYESQAMGQMPPIDGVPAEGWDGGVRKLTTNNKHQLKRSSSTSDLKKQRSVDSAFTGRIGDTISPAVLYDSGAGDVSKPLTLNEGSLHTPKLKCRVVGAYFEKLGSNSFAVYSIAVTDVENKTWFVKRRYRNFERLHRHLKDIPNYTLHLPPKRFLSSSIDDYFVHQRCILLDKYLQDLLSLANIAEQHEVWDFLSAASKNYSFGKSTSVMKTLAVNVDDAMDDIVRQFKGVSDGLRRKVVGSPPSLSNSPSLTMSEKITSSYLNEEDSNKSSLNYKSMDLSRSLSDDEGHDEEGSGASVSGWHSDNELNLKGFPPRVIKKTDGSRSLDSQKSEPLQKFDRVFPDQDYASNIMMTSDVSVDSIGVPPEWSPPNVSVPILNLVDKVFQLNRRGWLRRQVFWISKQILQLMMEDAIDDWLVRRIHWLRRDDVIAQGIRWVQDVLWPNGTFFIKLESNRERDDGSESSQKTTTSTTRVPKGSRPLSFEQQLEASRRAKDVEKILLGGAPTALVSLIGYKQYQRCAKDMYYFLQSTVCIKQLAYGMLELLLVSLFPELRDLILDIHKKHRQPA